MIICSYHVMYVFQSESALYSCMNVKELLARNRHEIWSLSDCNRTWMYNHLVHKQTLNYLTKLAKWLSCVVSTYYNMPVLSKESLDIQATIECGFALKCVHDMIRTYSQTHHTDKCSQHSSIIWPVWRNSWVFVYVPSGCGFESCCSHLNFRFCACFK